jgi:FtsZ-binding cell division protein ZapB
MLDFEIARVIDPTGTPRPAAASPAPIPPATAPQAGAMDIGIVKPKPPTNSEVTNIYEENDFLIAETKRLASMNNGLEMTVQRLEEERNEWQMKAASLEGRVQALDATVRTMTEYLETIYTDFGGDPSALPASQQERVEMIVDTLVAMLEGKQSGA